MATTALDALYEPGSLDKAPYVKDLCTGCRKEDTRCENCGAKLRTDGVEGLAVEMRPCGYGSFPLDEHTATRCKDRRERAIEKGLLPTTPTLDDATIARFSPETFDY